MKAGLDLQHIRMFLLVEAVVFVVAAFVHSGVLVDGYEHAEARVAESVLALVLFIGSLLSWIRPAWTRRAGIAAQGVALVGTLVGVFTIHRGGRPADHTGRCVSHRHRGRAALGPEGQYDYASERQIGAAV